MKAEPAPPALLDRIYSALLAQLRLTDGHRANLQRRGLSDVEIDRRAYRSLETGGYAKIARGVHESFGDDVLRVPGFIVKEGDGRRFLTLSAAPGIAIPVRDRSGRIVAIKIRADDADPARNASRYFYMSSAKHGGPGSSSPIHIPLGTSRLAKVVRLTEGELKADVTTTCTPIPTISAPGCSVWGNAIDVIAEMQPHTVKLAFDADCHTTIEVARALISVWLRLVNGGYAVEIERWNSSNGQKGIDDALAAGVPIDVLAGEDAIQYLKTIADAHGLDFEAPLSAFRCVSTSKGIVHLSLGRPDEDDRRVVIGVFGDTRHEDRIKAGSAVSRGRFARKFVKEAQIDGEGDLESIENAIQAQATLRDRLQEDSVSGSRGDRRSSGGGEAESQAKIAFEIAREGEIFRTPSGDAYTTVKINGHSETWKVRSGVFKQHLAREFYVRQQKAINAESIASAINLTEAEATFVGQEIPVHVRVADCKGRLYLDLGNKAWEAIEISKDGWRLVPNPPARFRRAKSALALPMPKRGGSMQLLAAILNVSPEDFRLIVGWLVNALFPRGPYPMLAFFAQQGSGKSNAAYMIRSVIDPNAAPLRTQPREERDLVITASNSWVVTYENLSHIPTWLSDAMCRIATGGGMATRELYTNDDEVVFDVQRSQMITSIEEVADKSDLLDRCLIIQLPKIDRSKRRAESVIRAEFESVRPLILGALLDAVVGAMREIDGIHIDGLPRMADFAYRATAAESALGWDRGSFMNAYEGNREAANIIALESSVIVAPLMKILEGRSEWQGSPTELYDALEIAADERTRRQKKWPANPRALSAALTRVTPNLAEVGWEQTGGRDPDHDRGRRIWFRRTPGFCVRTVRCVRKDAHEPVDRTQNPPSDASDAKSADISETLCTNDDGAATPSTEIHDRLLSLTAAAKDMQIEGDEFREFVVRAVGCPIEELDGAGLNRLHAALDEFVRTRADK